MEEKVEKVKKHKQENNEKKTELLDIENDNTEAPNTTESDE